MTAATSATAATPATATTTALDGQVLGWTVSPDRAELVTVHDTPGEEPTIELVTRRIGPDGAPDGEPPRPVTGPLPPDWRVLDWAGPRRLALWRPGRRSQLCVLDLAGDVTHRGEVLGRPLRCRLNARGDVLVLLVVSGADKPELWLHHAGSNSYLPVPDSGGVRRVGAWDADAGVFAADVDRTRFYRHGQAGCVEVAVDQPDDTRVTATAGCAAGRIGLTGTRVTGDTVPGVLDIATGRVRWFDDHPGGTAVDLAPAGTRLLTTTWDQQRHTYQVLDPAGHRTAVLDPGPTLATDVRLTRDERHLIGWHQSPADEPRLTRWAPPDPCPRPLAPRTSTPVGMRWRHRWVPDASGTDLPEWVFEPTGTTATGTVLFLHGGPRGRLKQEHDPVVEAMVRAGWSVVGPNYPGSSGYGERYLDLGRGDWGGVDAAALRRRLETLHDAGQPVCVYGQSYGGYLALRVAAELPHLVAGVAVWAPVTDLPALHTGMTGVRRRWLDDELGDLRLDQRVLWERSPVSQARVLAGTRLLIGHGRSDDRCPVDQSRRLVDLVRSCGADTGLRYLEEPGNHAPADWGPWSRAVVEHFAAASTEGRSGATG
ncbi:alpha/beta hydrolase family protein [Actinophytocola gossypii]|uniref:S9 family peptidase n=1 Tax=Actinophytocola gossypii TaxID=2812003 RepID=A0ABT2JHR9_9PSEU|nr:alpha/beta fold hydrolase [Actinophytocola gossypii]MCT2587059.1 S9 family peptidase [Actinophytocola gossypii]